MKTKKTTTKSLIVFTFVFFISGCSPFVENNMVEEIAPVIFWSVKDTGQGKINISTMVPPLVKEKKRLVTLEVDLLKEGEKEFNLVYYRELKAGQLRMVFINEELAKKGILTLIDTLLKDLDISQRLYLVIVTGSFEEYINNQVEKQENLDYFLYRMLKHYEKTNQGEMSIVNLHQFKNKLYTPYASPYLPVFKVTEDDFTYEGTALFQFDTLMETIKDVDDQIFQLIENDEYLKLFPLLKFSTTLGYLRSTTTIEVDRKNASFFLTVNVSSLIDEYQGDKDLSKVTELEALIKEIEAYLETRTTGLLKKMQELQVDPLEIGRYTLGPITKPMGEEEWLNEWQQMSVHVDYKLEIQPLTNKNPE
ncbi:Ger(x)C family spore germination protein [Halalkalibacterium ligniniphilum]|uniref:Ger(x)C family spore germination protein n=1 Tax=Halalkalibacterium ligniniphilum TaxID=1134413 RepID=UPI00034C52ED|nr:Ger(x)C family spore germination C-terminal domain-containing protein [Halalkalibacterium ligniniphilum]